jgi:photosystem II stability/assembly factor-like uncharacterized protein
MAEYNSDTPLSNSIGDIAALGDTVWVGSSKGLSKSIDRGKKWLNYYGTDPFGDEDISAIAYKNGIICAATAHSIEKNGQSYPVGSGIKLSLNNGETWYSCPQPVDTDSDTTIKYGINTLKALPVTVKEQNITYDLDIIGNYIWITSWAGGTRKAPIDSLVKNPEKYKWQRVVLPPDYLNSIKPTDTLHFQLSVSKGKLSTEENLNHMGFSVTSKNDSTIFVGTAAGINKSTDGGISWTKFNHLNQNHSISGNFVVAMSYNTVNNSIWAATWKANGETESYAVSSSTDGGVNWKNTLLDEKVHGFGFKDFDAIANSDNGSFRTSDLGDTWVKPTSIIDEETQLPLNTNVFYTAASQGNDIWFGTDNGLVKFEVQGGLWQGKWKIYTASPKLVSSNNSYAYPNPFSPDAEQVKIKYSTGGKRQNVTIRIFDFGMNLIKTVIQNAPRGEPIHQIEGSGTAENGVMDYWDGKDERGNIVPNGVYFYRIDFDSGDPVYGKILVVM